MRFKGFPTSCCLMLLVVCTATISAQESRVWNRLEGKLDNLTLSPSLSSSCTTPVRLTMKMRCGDHCESSLKRASSFDLAPIGGVINGFVIHPGRNAMAFDSPGAHFDTFTDQNRFSPLPAIEHHTPRASSIASVSPQDLPSLIESNATELSNGMLRKAVFVSDTEDDIELESSFEPIAKDGHRPIDVDASGAVRFPANQEHAPTSPRVPAKLARAVIPAVNPNHLGDSSNIVIRSPIVQPYNKNQYTFVVENIGTLDVSKLSIEISVDESSKIVTVLPSNSVVTPQTARFLFDGLVSGGRLQIHVSAESIHESPIVFEARMTGSTVQKFDARHEAAAPFKSVSFRPRRPLSAGTPDLDRKNSEVPRSPSAFKSVNKSTRGSVVENPYFQIRNPRTTRTNRSSVPVLLPSHAKRVPDNDYSQDRK